MTAQPTTNAKDTVERTEDLVTDAVDSIRTVGKMWVAHGLNVGRSALDLAAETLRVTADRLGDISAKIDDK
jgi:hypothetical protein